MKLTFGDPRHILHFHVYRKTDDMDKFRCECGMEYRRVFDGFADIEWVKVRTEEYREKMK